MKQNHHKPPWTLIVLFFHDLTFHALSALTADANLWKSRSPLTMVLQIKFCYREKNRIKNIATCKKVICIQCLRRPMSYKLHVVYHFHSRGYVLLTTTCLYIASQPNYIQAAKLFALPCYATVQWWMCCHSAVRQNSLPWLSVTVGVSPHCWRCATSTVARKSISLLITDFGQFSRSGAVYSSLHLQR